jgi:hypothetical protein
VAQGDSTSRSRLGRGRVVMRDALDHLFVAARTLTAVNDRDGTSRVKLTYKQPRRERHARAVAEGDVVSELFFEYRDDDP